MVLLLALSARAELPDGCVAKAADLPASSYHTAEDPRWAKDDIIVVLKEKRRVMLFDAGELVTLPDGTPACWQAGLGSGYPAGHKQRMGDMKTPEGWYATSDRPWSMFYGAITVHYPGVADAKRGVKQGLITSDQAAEIESAHAKGTLPPMETRLGGKILLHGGGGSTDWTLGCVALDDANIDALRAELPKSMRTQVLILP
ncbi:MAG: L,D-transpeptidase family protein [Alphaproteobacteria bacterium]|nr:L,D-transpeptidase family protein [Alphaproteobacteria bacterium]